MDFLKAIDTMPEAVYLKLKQAVEIGKWENGTKLTEQQKSTCLQAVMAWQAKHLDNHDHMTIGNQGQIIEQSKAQLKKAMSEQQIVRFNHDDF